MYPAACCIAPSPRFTAASDFRVGRRGKKIMAQEGEEAMTLDSALQELGMLSQASPLRSEYLNERERIKIGQGCIRPLYRVPCSSPQPDPNSESGSSSPLSSSLPNPSTLGLPRLSINSHFVTSITLGRCRQHRLNTEKIREEPFHFLLTNKNGTNLILGNLVSELTAKQDREGCQALQVLGQGEKKACLVDLS